MTRPPPPWPPAAPASSAPRAAPVSPEPAVPPAPLHTAELRFELANAAQAAAVARAVTVEAADAPEGATVAFAAHGARLDANVAATDGPALRAAVTGVVRLVDAAARSAALA